MAMPKRKTPPSKPKSKSLDNVKSLIVNHLIIDDKAFIVPDVIDFDNPARIRSPRPPRAFGYIGGGGIDDAGSGPPGLPGNAPMGYNPDGGDDNANKKRPPKKG